MVCRISNVRRTAEPTWRRANWASRQRAPKVGRLYESVGTPDPASRRLQLDVEDELRSKITQRLESDYRALTDDLAWTSLLITTTALYLNRVTGAEQVAIGLPVHNRSGLDRVPVRPGHGSLPGRCHHRRCRHVPLAAQAGVAGGGSHDPPRTTGNRTRRDRYRNGRQRHSSRRDRRLRHTRGDNRLGSLGHDRLRSSSPRPTHHVRRRPIIAGARHQQRSRNRRSGRSCCPSLRVGPDRPGDRPRPSRSARIRSSPPKRPQHWSSGATGPPRRWSRRSFRIGSSPNSPGTALCRFRATDRSPAHN